MAEKVKLAALVLLGLAPLAFSVPGSHYLEYKPAVSYYAPPKYEYSYGVHDDYTGDIKSAHESRVGGVTKGSYSVLQPDGIMRTVNYVADPWNGFQATVTNKGYSHHPVHGTTSHVAYPVVPAPKSIVLKTPMRPLAHPYRPLRKLPLPTTTTSAPPSPPPPTSHDDHDDDHDHDHHDYIYETHNIVYD